MFHARNTHTHSHTHNEQTPYNELAPAKEYSQPEIERKIKQKYGINISDVGLTKLKTISFLWVADADADAVAVVVVVFNFAEWVM